MGIGITRPGYDLRRIPASKGLTYPVEILTPDEIRALRAQCSETADGRRLLTVDEGALFQDGPASTFDNGSLARILSCDNAKRAPIAEFVYEVDPRAEPSAIFGVNGIVEVLPIDNAGSIGLLCFGDRRRPRTAPSASTLTIHLSTGIG